MADYWWEMGRLEKSASSSPSAPLRGCVDCSCPNRRNIATGTKRTACIRKVPDWYQETWSICREPTEYEVTSFTRGMHIGPGGRLDAVCEIDADGDVFVRGCIASVPDI